ncbi:hypothetical protein [Flavobacterium sp. UMI-01]|uniref:hypothetical protein n=1 Tax=Flavobacterium sp. UMI-01 TaxID=1441053 RepID=UPI001C7D40E0|nr:hypothetical protein [Flavobacterium sp. UMI-01]
MNHLEKINLGFNSNNKKIVIDNLNSFFVHNRNTILFQKHPLGFKYLKLGNISNFIEFRLHFWINTNEKHDVDLQIHDHSFDFESFVVSGSIINNKYEIISSGTSKGYVYDVKFRNEKSKLILNTDNCYIQHTESVKINCGEFYSMISSEFHESINDENLTITLLKITKSYDKTARVFSPKKLSSLSSFERTTLTIEENLKLIDKIIELTKFKN